ncbi:MAG: FAD-dependent oxidoreductase [Planctomycetaceae bacterium]|nr:FAD-dependent oxidoreductase [Planctomycetaceae bacterium]
MAIDTPARIAIIGAGPIGIETALYARFLGYDVDLFERGRIAEHVWQRGSVRWYTPWSANVSPLGVAALAGQAPDWRPLADDALAMGEELVARYWQPLAESDLVVDHLHLHTEVTYLARTHLIKQELLDDPARGDEDFLILTRNREGGEKLFTADAVIDCSGVIGNHRWAGQGGMPALGEMPLSAEIEYGVIDSRDASTTARYAGKRVLLIGGGHTAATNALVLGSLSPRPQVTWMTRREPLASANGPIDRMANDPLVERDRIAQQANALVSDPQSGIVHWSGTQLASIARAESGGYHCELVGDHAGAIDVDQIVASVGSRPDPRLTSELQVEFDRATEGLPNVATNVLTTEPNFYIIGAKSFGRDPRFTVSEGLRQIRQVFAIIGDRENLDLYRTIKA